MARPRARWRGIHGPVHYVRRRWSADSRMPLADHEFDRAVSYHRPTRAGYVRSSSRHPRPQGNASQLLAVRGRVLLRSVTPERILVRPSRFLLSQAETFG